MSKEAGAVLREGPPRGCLNVRGNPDDLGFGPAIATATGATLPLVPCTWTGEGDAAAYWLGPDEWLLTVPLGTEGTVEARLRSALEGSFSVVDTTGAQYFASLSGPNLGDVMAKSSPYDFHPRNFPAGRCVQTVFAKATALVAANPDGSFDLVFRRSYADYLRRWIGDAAGEYGFTDSPIPP